MKTPLLCFLSLFAAFTSGAATPFFLETGQDAYGVAALLALVVAFLACAVALHRERADLTRTILSDLARIEALLDDREFDHG
jgi:hypothetical protein